MRLRGIHDPAVYAERFAVLRAVVEENGGLFLDLHETLLRREFSDPVGHVSEAGARHMAELVGPVVLEILERGSCPLADAGTSRASGRPLCDPQP
jgi:hypothetical protein